MREPKREKMSEPAPLAAVLRQTLKASNIKVDLEVHRLWENWVQAVGPAIAQNARPEAIKGKLLLVNVSSSPWMQQLQFLKAELIGKINQAMGPGTVEDMRFQIGPIR